MFNYLTPIHPDLANNVENTFAMEHQPETNTVIESSNGIIDPPQPIKPSRFLNIPTSDLVQTHGLISNYIYSMPFENLPTQVILMIRNALDCQDSISALRCINGRTYSVLEKTLYKQNVSNHESSALCWTTSMFARLVVCLFARLSLVQMLLQGI